MANGSVMVNTVNNIRDALGGDGNSGSSVPNSSELMDTVLEIKDLVESGGGGGGGGGLVVNVTWNEDYTSATLDKNFNEIIAAIHEGIMPIFAMLYEEEGIDDSFYVLRGLSSYANEFDVVLVSITSLEFETYMFTSETATGTLTYTAGT